MWSSTDGRGRDRAYRMPGASRYQARPLIVVFRCPCWADDRLFLGIAPGHQCKRRGVFGESPAEPVAGDAVQADSSFDGLGSETAVHIGGHSYQESAAEPSAG